MSNHFFLPLPFFLFIGSNFYSNENFREKKKVEQDDVILLEIFSEILSFKTENKVFDLYNISLI